MFCAICLESALELPPPVPARSKTLCICPRRFRSKQNRAAIVLAGSDKRKIGLQSPSPVPTNPKSRCNRPRQFRQTQKRSASGLAGSGVSKSRLQSPSPELAKRKSVCMAGRQFCHCLNFSARELRRPGRVPVVPPRHLSDGAAVPSICFRGHPRVRSLPHSVAGQVPRVPG